MLIKTFAPLKKKKKEYWSGLSFPSPGDIPYSGIKPTSHWQVNSLLLTIGEVEVLGQSILSDSLQPYGL